MEPHNLAAQTGCGWFGDTLHKIQSNPWVRRAEKAGAHALATGARGVLEGVADVGVDSLLAETFPAAIPYVDKVIDSGAASLQKSATDWVDSKIDQSGQGWRDVVRELGDPADAADRWRQQWDDSDLVPSGIKQIGDAGLAGLQLGTRLGKQL